MGAVCQDPDVEAFLPTCEADSFKFKRSLKGEANVVAAFDNALPCELLRLLQEPRLVCD